MPRTFSDPIREAILEQKIMEGNSIKTSMIEAGYSPIAAKKASYSKRLGEIMKNAKEKFFVRFNAEAEKIGLTPEFIAKRLYKIIKLSGDSKSDFNAVQASKAAIQVMQSLTEKNGNIAMQGVFVIPVQTENKQNWNTKTRKFRQIVDVKESANFENSVEKV